MGNYPDFSKIENTQRKIGSSQFSQQKYIAEGYVGGGDGGKHASKRDSENHK